MRTIKTLNQAFKLSKGQLTAQQLINGQLYTSKGWESFNIDFDLKKLIARNVSELLGGREATKNAILNTLTYGTPPQHWGLDRVIVVKRKNPRDKRKNYIFLLIVQGKIIQPNYNKLEKH